MSITVPASHFDLIDQPLVVTLATMMPDGQPHTTAIWQRYDGELIRFTTSRGTQKEKNLRANPQVSLMAARPAEPVSLPGNPGHRRGDGRGRGD